MYLFLAIICQSLPKFGRFCYSFMSSFFCNAHFDSMELFYPFFCTMISPFNFINCFYKKWYCTHFPQIWKYFFLYWYVWRVFYFFFKVYIHELQDILKLTYSWVEIKCLFFLKILFFFFLFLSEIFESIPNRNYVVKK